MSQENAVPLQPIMGHKKRKKSTAEKKEEGELTTLDVIKEIMNPTLKIPETIGHYKVPDVMKPEDIDELTELDEKKVVELKEVFSLFDTDQDGLISKEDLRMTLTLTSGEPEDELVTQMMEEVPDPLDFDAFVHLMGHRTIELDAEDVLLEAWSKWDLEGTGFIDQEKIYCELVNYGDKFSNEEAMEALALAPLAKKTSLEPGQPKLIDYPEFCRILSGVRKRKPNRVQF